MKSPLPYSFSCNQKMVQMFGFSDDKLNEQTQWVDKIKDTFFRNLDYTLVYKNFDYTVGYHSLIYQGNRDDTNLGSYKKFISYPYDEIKFSIGDYISFTYGGVLKHWLITSLDKMLYYDINGRIERCNILLKWMDENGMILSYPAVAKDKLTSDAFNFNSNIVINQGKLDIEVQTNEFTKEIPINKRFLIGDPYQAFKVIGLVNYTDTNSLVLDVMIDNKSPEDNITLGIADYYQNIYTLSINESDFEQIIGYTGTLSATVKNNDKIIITPLKWTSSDNDIATINNDGEFSLLTDGNVEFTCEMEANSDIKDIINVTVTVIPIDIKQVRINPNKTELLQGYEQIYSVYKYINDVQQIDEFDIQTSGANNSKYNLTVIDGNNFKIENLNYSNIDLLVTCTSLVDSSVGIISIKLRGLF